MLRKAIIARWTFCGPITNHKISLIFPQAAQDPFFIQGALPTCLSNTHIIPPYPLISTQYLQSSLNRSEDTAASNTGTTNSGADNLRKPLSIHTEQHHQVPAKVMGD